MKKFSFLWLAALAVALNFVVDVEGNTVTADFARKFNKDAAADQNKEIVQDTGHQEKNVEESRRAVEKEMEEKERVERKAMENMSEEKLKAMNLKKREDDARAEMKTLMELERLEKKFRLKTDSGMSTELKSLKKGKHDKMNTKSLVHLVDLAPYLGNYFGFNKVESEEVKYMEMVKKLKKSGEFSKKKQAETMKQFKKKSLKGDAKLLKHQKGDETLLKYAVQMKQLKKKSLKGDGKLLKHQKGDAKQLKHLKGDANLLKHQKSDETLLKYAVQMKQFKKKSLKSDAKSLKHLKGDAKQLKHQKGDAKQLKHQKGDAKLLKHQKGDAKLLKHLKGNEKLLKLLKGDAKLLKQQKGDAKLLKHQKGDAKLLKHQKGDAKLLKHQKGDAKLLKHLKGNAKLLKLLKGDAKLLKHLNGDATLLKHAPIYMKEGKTLNERRFLKELRRRRKREALAGNWDVTETKSVLRKKSMAGGDLKRRYSEEDTDYWSDEKFITHNGNTLRPLYEDLPEYEDVYNGLDYEGGAQVDPNPTIASPLDGLENVEEIPAIASNDLPGPDTLENETPPPLAIYEDEIPEIAEDYSSSLPGIEENEIGPLDYPVLLDELDNNEITSDTNNLPTTNPLLVPYGIPSSDIPYVSVSSPSAETTVDFAAPTEGREVPFITTAAPDMGLSTFISAVPSVSPIEPLVSYEEQPSIGSSAPLLPPVEVVTLPPYVSSTEPVTTHEPTTIPPPWTTTPTSWPWLSPDSSVEVCGKARFGPENRSSRRGLKILEGKEALPGSFPWQVAILDDDRDLHCGGTLIAPRWVVTAAHCIKKKLFVRLFEHHMMEKDGFEVEQKVRRIYRHPDFNTSTIDNDIALLRLPALPAFPEESTGVVSRGVTSRACLPANAEDFPPVGTRCMVMGWGKASMVHNYGTDVLMYTRLPIISRKACIKANRKVITENMFCAGHYKGGSDTCSGDSGGPLLCSVSGAPGEETWTMYGVTSFGDGCGNVGKMGVYAKVNNYLQWMSDIMSRYY